MLLNTDLAVTLDVDWAPDFTIDFAARLLVERQVRATWFVTHDSPAIERLRQHSELFELGIHPNFLPGSTHGDAADDVLSHCLELVSGAQTVRTHSLVQSSVLFQKILESTTITTDVSLFLPLMPHVKPFLYSLGGRTLLRVPYVWEDSYEFLQEEPCWHLGKIAALGRGLKVINFHPVHIYLNSSALDTYQTLKQQHPRLSDWTPEVAAPYSRQGEVGAQSLFIQLADFLATKRSWRMCDLWRKSTEILDNTRGAIEIDIDNHTG